MTNEATAVAEAARAALHQANHPAFFFDFDGVLSRIVDETHAAQPIDPAIPMLKRLLGIGATVCLVSSRPVEFLQQQFPVDDDPGLAKLRMVGTRGLASYEGGTYHEIPDAEMWREKIDAAVDEATEQIAEQGLDNIEIEPKGLSLSLHTRHNLDAANQVAAIARELAERHGLSLDDGKKVYELHPHTGITKGTAIAERIDGHDWALFAGDDVGDLPGFEVLAEHRSPSLHTLAVGVGSNESPPELIEATDLVVDGPDGLQTLLRFLLDDPAAG